MRRPCSRPPAAAAARPPPPLILLRTPPPAPHPPRSCTRRRCSRPPAAARRSWPSSQSAASCRASRCVFVCVCVCWGVMAWGWVPGFSCSADCRALPFCKRAPAAAAVRRRAPRHRHPSPRHPSPAARPQVDIGTVPLPGSARELYTQGLDNLRARADKCVRERAPRRRARLAAARAALLRAGAPPPLPVRGNPTAPFSPTHATHPPTHPPALPRYYAAGARFAKWRAVITIDPAAGLPSPAGVASAAEGLAKYARICQVRARARCGGASFLWPLRAGCLEPATPLCDALVFT